MLTLRSATVLVYTRDDLAVVKDFIKEGIPIITSLPGEPGEPRWLDGALKVNPCVADKASTFHYGMQVGVDLVRSGRYEGFVAPRKVRIHTGSFLRVYCLACAGFGILHKTTSSAL